MNVKVHFTDKTGTDQVVEFTGAAEHHIESFVMMLTVHGCTNIRVEVLGW